MPKSPAHATLPAMEPNPVRPHYRVWPRRVPRAMTPPATTLWHNLATSAERYPQKDALVFFGTRITYAELMRHSERLAAFLQSVGVAAGDRVLLDMQNCPQLVIAHFAILRADAVVVPVNPMNRAEELKHYILDPDARVALTTADLAGELAAANRALSPPEQLRHIVVTRFTDAFDPGVTGADAPPPAWHDWLGTAHPPPASLASPASPSLQLHRWEDAIACTHVLAPHAAGPDDLAVLPYTSGTTGLPKGCIHPHSTFMANAVAGAVWGNCCADNTVLAVVPMFHITGMVSMLHTAILVGATLVVMPRWDRDLAGRLISHRRVTHWTNIPTMVIDLLASPNFSQFDLSSLLYIGGGGAAMPQAVAERLFGACGLRYSEGYGLTETAAPSHANPPDAPRQQCLGIPFVGVDSRIVDPETLREVAVGEQGEIVTRGPQVFHGYWKRPDATEAAFFELDGHRFFRTGDLGRMDADGYFYLTDRLKRMINASGFKVWPAEVEALMFRHPAIQEACVIATRDAYRGESVKAVVVLRTSHASTTPEEIIAWCRDNMAVYKAPRVVEIVASLPKSGSGKVMWRQLQEAEGPG